MSTESDHFSPDKLHILIVEDDVIQSRILQEFLKILRYRVSVAASAEEAQTLIQQDPADLFLLDLHLPGKDGFSLLEDLRRESSDAAVLLMSADRTQEALLRALKSGAEEFLQKPLPLSELSIRVQNILETVWSSRLAEKLNLRLEKEKGILSAYFSPETVNTILDADVLKAGGNLYDATLLVLDLRDSTGHAEKLGALQFADFLNMITVDLMDLVFGHQGSIARLTGDGMIVSFGIPGPASDAASRALACARSMADYFDSVQEIARSSGLDSLGFGIGIASGAVFAGNIGNFRRMEYAIAGDALSRASRLESLTKKLGVPVLADKKTMERVAREERTPALEVSIRGYRTSLYPVLPRTAQN